MEQEGIFAEIRPAAALAATEVQRLVALVNAAYRRHSWLFPLDRVTVSSFHTETTGSDLILLRDGTGYCGMATIHPDYDDPDALYLGMAVVDPTRQGRGLGTLLVWMAEAEAGRRGFSRLTLITVVDIGNAAYYERLGYRIIHAQPQPAGTWGALAPYTLATMLKDLHPDDPTG